MLHVIRDQATKYKQYIAGEAKIEDGDFTLQSMDLRDFLRYLMKDNINFAPMKDDIKFATNERFMVKKVLDKQNQPQETYIKDYIWGREDLVNPLEDMPEDAEKSDLIEAIVKPIKKYLEEKREKDGFETPRYPHGQHPEWLKKLVGDKKAYKVLTTAFGPLFEDLRHRPVAV